MAVASKLTEIGIMAFSLAVGFLAFYLLSPLRKEQKKKHMDELLGQSINFILFIWVGKIVLNLSVFLSDPLSVLAYPSNSASFYFAVGAIALLLFHKSKWKNIHILPLLESFMYVFLIGSFTYEFVQVVWNDDSFALGYLILLTVLIGIFFFLRERVAAPVLLMVLVTVWSLGMIGLASLQPFVTVFGYMMSPWFVGLFFVLSMGGLTYKLRKGGHNVD